MSYKWKRYTFWFGANFEINAPERYLNIGFRAFGLDVDLAAYGWLNDMVFPFMFVPTLRGLFFQTLCLAAFVGRLPGNLIVTREE